LLDKTIFEKNKDNKLFLTSFNKKPIAICLKDNGILLPKKVFNV
jgi:hypothetical protein